MTGVLIIHGFAGSRDEVRVLYDFLSDKGYMVSMPVLEGHEAGFKELAKSTRRGWIKSVEDKYLELCKKCDKVVVVGFSMGGLIAIQLYQKYKFYKLITVNTPIYYWNMKQIVKNIFSDFNMYSKKYFTATTNKPFSALVEFQKLLNATKPLVKNIDCECLIIQTQDDDTVNIKSADHLYKNVSGNKTIFKPKYGEHIVFKSKHYAPILEQIEKFI